MKKSNRTKCFVHPAFWVLCALWLLSGKRLLFVAYVLALLGHEVAHIIAGKLCGGTVERIELTPFGAVAHIEDMQMFSYFKQAMIALAGPAFSLLAAAMVLLSPLRFNGLAPLLFKANFSLFLINILPVLPLDGGRICFAALAGSLGIQRAAKWFARAGICTGVLLTLFAIWIAIVLEVYSISLITIGCYLAYAAHETYQSLACRCLHSQIEKRVALEKRGALPVRQWAVNGEETIRFVFERMHPGIYYRVLIIDSVTMQVVQCIDEKQLVDAFLNDMNLSLKEAFCLSNEERGDKIGTTS